MSITAYAVLISPVDGFVCLNKAIAAYPKRADALNLLRDWREISQTGFRRKKIGRVVRVEINPAPKKPRAKKK